MKNVVSILKKRAWDVLYFEGDESIRTHLKPLAQLCHEDIIYKFSLLLRSLIATDEGVVGSPVASVQVPPFIPVTEEHSSVLRNKYIQNKLCLIYLNV